MAESLPTPPRTLILASASPRRHQLLADAGIRFRVVESRIAEVRRKAEGAGEYALRMAHEKALAVSATHSDETVLAADTVVECEGQILGKPADAAEARAMLKLLSGRTHSVVTAFAIARAGAILNSEGVVTRVTFRELHPIEIDEYVAGGEPFDKAGAYGIQGAGGRFIASVEGSRDNVMGLPTIRVLAALAQCGIGRTAR